MWSPIKQSYFEHNEAIECLIQQLRYEYGSLHGIPYNHEKDGMVFEQWTWLFDRNGKMIFEGDIVKAANRGVHAFCEVRWGQGTTRFFLYRASGGIVWNLSGGGKDYNREMVEVVGNIHQNSELLIDHHRGPND
jgi:uncharacterized phage protein (TIGR01671 family)